MIAVLKEVSVLPFVEDLRLEADSASYAYPAVLPPEEEVEVPRALPPKPKFMSLMQYLRAVDELISTGELEPLSYEESEAASRQALSEANDSLEFADAERKANSR